MKTIQTRIDLIKQDPDFQRKFVSVFRSHELHKRKDFINFGKKLNWEKRIASFIDSMIDLYEDSYSPQEHAEEVPEGYIRLNQLAKQTGLKATDLTKKMDNRRYEFFSGYGSTGLISLELAEKLMTRLKTAGSKKSRIVEED